MAQVGMMEVWSRAVSLEAERGTKGDRTWGWMGYRSDRDGGSRVSLSFGPQVQVPL